MSRLAVFTLAAALVATGFADPRPTLDRAREEYLAKDAKLREGVLENLRKAEDIVRKSGDKDRLDRVKRETEAFERRRTMPTVIPVAEFRRQSHRARADLEAAYGRVIRDLTKAGSDDQAEAVRREMTALLTASRDHTDAATLEGRCFKVFETKCTWHEAREKCEAMGGHLAIVTGEKENRLLVALMQAAKVDGAWLGGTDEAAEGQWTWVDGTPLQYAKWHVWNGPKDREPNNYRGIEDFLVIRATFDGDWFDVPDVEDGSPVFICEWD